MGGHRTAARIADRVGRVLLPLLGVHPLGCQFPGQFLLSTRRNTVDVLACYHIRQPLDRACPLPPLFLRRCC
jgi:hypothetical protein